MVTVTNVVFSVYFSSFGSLVTNLEGKRKCMKCFFSGTTFNKVYARCVLPMFATLPFSMDLYRRQGGGTISCVISERKGGECVFTGFVIDTVSKKFITMYKAMLLFLVLTVEFPVTKSRFRKTMMSSCFRR